MKAGFGQISRPPQGLFLKHCIYKNYTMQRQKLFQVLPLHGVILADTVPWEEILRKLSICSCRIYAIYTMHYKLVGTILYRHR